MTELTLSDMIRSGKTMNLLSEDRLLKIEKELLEEPCEGCNRKTAECGPLMAKDVRDGEGHNTVLMLCARCITKKGKKVKK